MADLRLRAIITVTDRATGSLRNINRQLSRIQAPFRTLGRQLRTFDRNSGFQNLRRATGRLAGQFALLGGAAAGASGAVFAFAERFASQGDNIAKTADKIGFSVEALQEWRFAADRSGVSTELLDTALVAFTKRMGEARAETGGLNNLLKKVNPQFLEQLKAVKSNEEAFGLLLEGISKLESPQQRAALAAAAFSRAGVDLVNIAKDGAEGMSALRLEARRLGLVIDDQTARASEGFVDSLTNLRATMTGVFNVIGAQLLPKFQPLIDGFTKWAVANRELIATKIDGFIKTIGTEFGKFADFLRDNEETIKKVWDAIGGLKGVLIGLGAVIASPIILALVGVFTALLSPVGLFAAALVAAGAAGVFLTSKIEELGNVVKPIIAEFSTSIKAGLDNTFQAFTGFGDAVTGFFTGLWSSMLDSASNAFGSLIQMIKNLVGGPLNSIRSFFGVGPSAPEPPQNNTESGTRPNTSNRPNLLRSAGGKEKVSGRIVLDVNSQVPVRTRSIRSDNPGLALDVDSGLAFAQ